jgi:DNA-binding MarR family transcriptional regulator
VVRRKSDEDRRKVHVYLTPQAKALHPVLMPAVAEVNAVALAGLTPAEVAVLRKALTQVGRNLATEADETLDSAV